MSHTEPIALSVVMPALNEEKNIAQALAASLAAFDEYRIDGEIIVVNDGSSDSTARIADEMSALDTRIRMISHERPRGIGASFWDGVDAARGFSAVMLPGDNENDPREIFQYHALLEHVDIVIPFVYNKEVRSIFRNALSFVYRFIINSTFGVYFNYTNGTNLYRTSILYQLKYRSEGFFYQTDMLIRLVKQGYLFAEVPCRLGVRKGGVSRASTFPSFLRVARGYLRLVEDIYLGKERKAVADFAPNSMTKARRHGARQPAAAADTTASAPDELLQSPTTVP